MQAMKRGQWGVGVGGVESFIGIKMDEQDWSLVTLRHSHTLLVQTTQEGLNQPNNKETPYLKG